MTNLSQFTINGTTPFWSPADSADQCLAQAKALLTLLAGAHNVCEEITTEQTDAFDNLRHEISANALDGIGSLIALAMYQLDAAHKQRAAKANASKWIELRDAFLTATADEKAQGRNEAAFGTPECEAYEAETARLANARSEAFRALMLYPAPDSASLAFKIEVYATITEGDAWDGADKMLAQMTADAKRLAA